MSDIYIGRQPIYDRRLDVYAYELLFRDAQNGSARFTDGDQATTDVIVNTFLEIGLDNIVGDRLAFINLTRAFFVSERNISLPKDRVVLELLEDIDADEEVVAGVRRLSEQGYRIALDDFIYHESLQPLVDLADLVKIDVMALDREAVREHVQKLRQYPLQLLAEKVETQESLDFCMALGFDYFQGYFFAQPKVIRGRRLPDNRLALLGLLSRLQDPDLGAAELEELIAGNTTFGPRILRYANSAATAAPRRITSVREAIEVFGLATIKSWTTLLAMSQADRKPAELVVTAMVRARMAECMAVALNAPQPDTFFTVGLFSALDALVDNSMEEILTQLPLADPLATALLRHRGLHGEVLDCVISYERGQWDKLGCQQLGTHKLRDCYLKAVQWASTVSRHLVEE